MYARDTALIATPVGLIRITGDDAAIMSVHIGREDGPRSSGATGPVRAAAAQLIAWFDGALTSFDLPLAPASTARGAVLRQAIVDTVYGETASYGALARAIRSSARAIGQACRRNPFPIIVPCHRILGGSGHYSGGDGLPTKHWLLAHEQRHREQVNG